MLTENFKHTFNDTNETKQNNLNSIKRRACKREIEFVLMNRIVAKSLADYISSVSATWHKSAYTHARLRRVFGTVARAHRRGRRTDKQHELSVCYRLH